MSKTSFSTMEFAATSASGGDELSAMATTFSVFSSASSDDGVVAKREASPSPAFSTADADVEASPFNQEMAPKREARHNSIPVSNFSPGYSFVGSGNDEFVMVINLLGVGRSFVVKNLCGGWWMMLLSERWVACPSWSKKRWHQVFRPAWLCVESLITRKQAAGK